MSKPARKPAARKSSAAPAPLPCAAAFAAYAARRADLVAAFAAAPQETPTLDLAALMPAPWEQGAPQGAEQAAPEPAPFVKLDKAALPAKGTPEREQYRKARRAAARALRRRLAA